MAMEVDYYGPLAFAYPRKCFSRVPLPAAATPIVDDEEEELVEFARMLDAALEANGSVEEGPAADEAVYFGFAALALALEAAMDEDGEEYQGQDSDDFEAMDES